MRIKNFKLISLLCISATLVACGSGGNNVNGNPSDVGNPIDIVNPPIDIVNPPIDIVNPPIDIVNPPIDIVNPPIDIVNPPIDIVNPIAIDKETQINATPDSPAEIMQGESFNFSVTRTGGSADYIVVSAVFVDYQYGLIVSEPVKCQLSLGSIKSCHFSAIYTGQSKFDVSLAKVVPLSYAVANNSSYHIKVTAITSDNAKVESSPVLDFSLYTPVTDPNAVIKENRFTQEGDCMIDNLTGLMWPKNGNLLGAKTWSGALAAVANMNNTSEAIGYNLCGYTDWHLPTVNELVSLTNDESPNPGEWLVGNQGFNHVKPNFYWSSTSYAPSSVNRGWGVGFGYGGGGVGEGSKGHFGFVWPVRRGK